MASLTKLIQTRAVYERFAGGSGLEKGEIFTWTPSHSNNSTPFPLNRCGQCSKFCFQSPGCGTAVIEIWGAGGSSAKSACCSFSIPGNPGAYSRKTVYMTPCGYVWGCVGHSCGNGGQSCNNCMVCRGCSCPTHICWHTGINLEDCHGRMCAMGGRGGWNLCQPSNSGYTCFVNCTFAGSQPPGFSDGCGLICNYSTCGTLGRSDGIGGFEFCSGNNQMFSGSEWNVCRWMACAYGGDVNCCGGFSCTLFRHCNACCQCCFTYYVKLPFNMWTEKSSVVEVNMSGSDSDRSMHYLSPWYNTTAGLTRSPTNAMPLTYCMTGAVFCGCYEMQGCIAYVGVGVPGFGGSPCTSNMCDYGYRGGSGGVRITWYKNTCIANDIMPTNNQ